jgi:hypothetical protein
MRLEDNIAIGAATAKATMESQRIAGFKVLAICELSRWRRILVP